MINKKVYLIITIIFTTIMTSCMSDNNHIKEFGFKNSSFEFGDLSGWKAYGDAFTNDHISFELRDNQGSYFNQTGDFFYYGGLNNEQGKTGYMISEPFTLKGNGIIGYLIGAGRDDKLTYVSVLDSKNNEIAKSGNNNDSNSNSMYRQVFDLKEYIGQKLRIKVVDNDNTNLPFNYINVDDFIINFQGVANMSITLQRANDYVEKHINEVNPQYRMTYHAMSPLNWSNDPNGLIWFQDKFHLFYQYNPYDPAWGPMYWGHQTTTDFIKWERQPIALAPDKNYDSELGAFSGTAIEKDGILNLMYTSVGNGHQTQSIATSSDGINFTKLDGNPVIPASQNPEGVNPAEIRDPKVFLHDGMYYVILGTKINGKGQLVLYKSTNLIGFTYVGALFNTTDPHQEGYIVLDGVFECPDFFIIDGKQILISSPQHLPKDGIKYQNLHSNIYMIGNLDFNTGKWSYNEFDAIDSGFDFYAPQTAKLPDGRTIMIAWMQMWDRTLPTATHGWAGAYTLPRELSIKNNKLYQAPVREIENYRKNYVSYQNVIVNSGENKTFKEVKGKTVELEVVFDINNQTSFGVELFKGTHNSTKIIYDRESSILTLDRSRSGMKINGAEANSSTRSVKVVPENGEIKLRIFLDVSSVEVFINDGISTLTANVYPDLNDTGISFFSLGGDTKISLNKYDIIV